MCVYAISPCPRQRFFSDSSEGTPQDSPLKNNPFISDPSADSEKQRRRQKLEAQFEALVLADTGKRSNPGQPRDYVSNVHVSAKHTLIWWIT